jgi:hypothetical protein
MWLAIYGSSRAFYCDNGTEFIGDFNDLCENRYLVMSCIKGRPYYPKSQESIERANLTFKRKLYALRKERESRG